MRKGKLYVGVGQDGIYRIFRSKATPKERTHGTLYKFATGPFKSKRHAQAYINSMMMV